MKAFQLVGGSADVDATTALNEVPQPDPGPGQVLVRIGGAGACHSDVSLMEFSAAGRRETPMTLGHENAGWIEAFGPGTLPTAGLEIGAPVAVYGAWGCGQCPNCRKGMENYCLTGVGSGPGLSVDGGMAEYLLVPAARYLVPLGDMAPADAAPLTDAGLTPYHAVKRSLHLLVPGSHVVVIGAGGLGHLAVQFLKALSPATVICVDQRESALAVVAGLGADHTVVAGPDAAVQLLHVPLRVQRVEHLLGLDHRTRGTAGAGAHRRVLGARHALLPRRRRRGVSPDGGRHPAGPRRHRALITRPSADARRRRAAAAHHRHQRRRR